MDASRLFFSSPQHTFTSSHLHHSEEMLPLNKLSRLCIVQDFASFDYEVDCHLPSAFTQQVLRRVSFLRHYLSWPIYVNVDSPNLGFPHFNFLGPKHWYPPNRGVPVKKKTCIKSCALYGSICSYIAAKMKKEKQWKIVQ